MRFAPVFASFSLTLVAACGASFGAGDSSGQQGLGAGGTSEVDTPATGSTSTTTTTTTCGECKFDRYNLNVLVGDTFVVTNFVTCSDPLSAHSFGLEGGGDWSQLDNMNSGLPVTITDADAQSGNHGTGEWRITLLDQNGAEVDHMTIRIGHDTTSDITPADALAHTPAACSSTSSSSSGSSTSGSDDGSTSGSGDGGGTSGGDGGSDGGDCGGGSTSGGSTSGGSTGGGSTSGSTGGTTGSLPPIG